MPEEPSDAAPEGGRTIDHLNNDLVRRVVNVLTEAPYFYRDDDPPLFQFLRRHKAAFAAFFKDFFGWTLRLDGRSSFLVKSGDRENPALRTAESDQFHLSRRNHCIVFALVLEYFETEARRVNHDYENDNYLQFFYSQFYEYAKARFRQLLGDRAPDDAVLRRDIQDTWEILKRYRFIRHIPPTPSEAQELGGREGELFEFLPAVAKYDGNVLRDAAWLERLRSAPEEPSVP